MRLLLYVVGLLAIAEAKKPLQQDEDETPNSPVTTKPKTVPANVADNIFDCYLCNGASVQPNELAACQNPTSTTKTCKTGPNGSCWSFARYNDQNALISVKRGCLKSLEPSSEEGQRVNSDNPCETKQLENNVTVTACAEKCSGQNLCNASPTPGQSSGLSTGAIIGIVVGSVVAILLLAGLGYYFYSKQDYSGPVPQEEEMS